MSHPPIDPAVQLAGAVTAYRGSADVGTLRASIRTLLAAPVGLDVLVAAVEPYRDVPEVTAPVYERVVAARPDDPRALVILANAYWLMGRGPDVVQALAARAIAADPASRAAWHLWALAESDPRTRTERWKHVAARFPGDELARASLADNAASLAGADRDHDALALAIDTYESLLATAAHPDQRAALERAIDTLRGWRL